MKHAGVIVLLLVEVMAAVSAAVETTPPRKPPTAESIQQLGDPYLPGGADGLDDLAACGRGRESCFEPHPTPGCNSKECCGLVCELIPECCDNEWEDFCAEFAETLCDVPSRCETSTRDCFSTGRVGGCENPICCRTVCSIDPFCCGTQWDEICVTLATEQCVPQTPCAAPTSVTRFENETCETPVNNGCDGLDEVLYTDVVLGDIVGASTWATITRDVDWFRIDATATSVVSVSIVTEFPAEVSVIEGDCESGFAAVSISHASPCETLTLTVPAPEDELFVVVTPAREDLSFIRGIPCRDERIAPPESSFGNTYLIAFVNGE